MQDVLMCVQMQKTLDDPDRMKFPNDEFYFKTAEEMAEAFPNDPDALETTLEIADKCNFKLTYGNYMYPKYEPVTGQTPKDYFRDLIEAGLKKKYKQETPEIRHSTQTNAIYRPTCVGSQECRYQNIVRV